MVVIAIIALLSSIVLSSLSDARVKAKNAAVNLQVLQYRNALELYNSIYKTYPLAEDENWYCLGKGYPGQICGWMSGQPNATESTLLTNSLLPYIQPATLYTSPIRISANDFVGGIYRCANVQNNACQLVHVIWALSGKDQGCNVPGSTVMTGQSTLSTLCLIQLMGSNQTPIFDL